MMGSCTGVMVLFAVWWLVHEKYADLDMWSNVLEDYRL